MPSVVLDLLTIVAVVAVLRARPAVAVAVLVVEMVVFPPTLVVPHTHTEYATLTHVLGLAGVARLVVMRIEGGRTKGMMRGTPVHVALISFIALMFTFGVVFVADAGGLGSADVRMTAMFEQLAFFAVTLALLRATGDVDIALRALAVAAVIAALIALAEHVTHLSWGHWLFAHATQNRLTNAAHELAVRGGTRRVKAGSDFALEFGWVMVLLLPAVVITALRNKWSQVTLPIGIALVSVAVYWSYSRSALAGLVIVLAVLALAAREWRIAYVVGVALVGFVGVWAAHPAVAQHLSESVASGSINTRYQRLGPVLQSVAAHPFRGLGLGLLNQSGFPTTDNAFLLNYVEVGALGVVALAVLLLVALGQALRGLALADDDARMLCAGAVAAVVGYIGAAVFYDAFTLEQGIDIMWVFIAVATVVIEANRGPLRLPAPARSLVAATAAIGVGLGFVAAFAAPTFVGDDLLFTTLPSYTDALPYNPVTAGTILTNTVCTELANLRLQHASVTCQQQDGIGQGRLHVEAADRRDYARAVTAVGNQVRAHGDAAFATYPLASPSTGRRTVWTTAPLWVPVGLLGLLLLVPWRRRDDDPRAAYARRPGGDRGGGVPVLVPMGPAAPAPG